jgi:hypothetical protein
MTDVRRHRLVSCVATGLMYLAVGLGCSRRSVRGQIVTSDGRVGVPCVLEMRDHRYKDRRILGLMRVSTGQDIDGEFEAQPPNTPLHPISETHEVTIRCDGYTPVERTLTLQQLREGADLGTMTVTRVAN